jgi:hypothetical protein
MIEAENNTMLKGRKYLIALVLFILAFMIYYAIMAISAPGRQLNKLTNEYGYKPDGKNTIDEKVFSDSTYLNLLKEKAFNQARIAMAETDSISLVLNLADSTAELQISGVTVHSSHFSRMDVSKIIRTGNEYIMTTMFSRPLTITDDYSSIKKEPLVIKMAPKDTSEFRPDIILDTADYEPVNFIIEIDTLLRIYIYQQEKLNRGDGRQQFMFDLRFRLHNFSDSFKKICVFKVPDYHPFIKIRIPRANAKIIYRALPRHGQVTVYM